MLKEIIYDHLKNKKREYHKPTEITFSPSYLCDCRRKIYYKKTIEPSNPMDEHGKLKCEIGDLIHEYITGIISQYVDKRTGEEYKKKELFDLTWSYREDDTITIKGDKYIVEKKSTYFSGFKSAAFEPHPENILQLYMYMLLEEVNKGILLYFGRDNCHIKEYSYTIETLNQKYHKLLDEKIVNMHHLKKQIESGTIPDRDYKAIIINGEMKKEVQRNKVKYKSDWQCGYCDYRGLCWKGVENNI